MDILPLHSIGQEIRWIPRNYAPPQRRDSDLDHPARTVSQDREKTVPSSTRHILSGGH